MYLPFILANLVLVESNVFLRLFCRLMAPSGGGISRRPRLLVLPKSAPMLKKDLRKFIILDEDQVTKVTLPLQVIIGKGEIDSHSRGLTNIMINKTN